MLRLMLAAALIVFASAAAYADEPKKKEEPEKIPAPKVVQPLAPESIVPPPRSDTREVWVHYGVNRLGRFVPRVIQTPYGAYYSRDLQPYPFAGIQK
jgi:hypothetical protein